MDDALEDELIYDTVVTHLNFISKLMVSLTAGVAGSSVSSSTVSVGGNKRLFFRTDVTIYCTVITILTIVTLLAAIFISNTNNHNNFINYYKLTNLKYLPSVVFTKVHVLLANLSPKFAQTGSRIVRFGQAGLSSTGADLTSSNGGSGLSSTATGAGVWELRRPNVGVYALQGRRNKMEDRFSVLEADDQQLIGVFELKSKDLEGTASLALYGVFDGHGGDMAADFVEKTLFKSLLSRLEVHCSADKGEIDAASSTINKLCNPDFAQLLSEEILAVDKKLLEVSKASKDYAGTTALVAVVYGNKLVVANVGDSRGVVCDKKGFTIPLSFDHKPQQLKEQKRIKQAGGLVTFNGVWRVAGILATSRALGDYPLKDRNLIIADPDVLTFNLDDLQPKFMILASDGLWDMFSNEEAVSFIKSHLHEPDHGAKSIVQQAYQRGSLDNITVLVVTFPSKSVK